MPRRERYRTDDEDDDLRRADASGGGIPAWVWLIGGGGVCAALMVVAVGFAFFSSRRAVQQDMARAETVRMEVDAEQAMIVAKAERPRPAEPEPEPDEIDEEPVMPVLSLERIANGYRTDPDAADGRYAGKRVRVRFEVTGKGAGWLGATATIVPNRAREAVPNVIFRFAGANAAIGSTVVIEGRCAGLAPDATTEMKLTFTECRVIRQ
jgi:hypothetical protein